MNKFFFFKKLSFLFVFLYFCTNIISACLADEIFKIKAERIKYENNNNKIIAEGNAEATHSLDKTLSANKIIYNKKSGIISAFGKSKFIDNNLIISANQFRYDSNLKVVDAKENVILSDSKGNKFFFDSLKFNSENQMGEAFNITSNFNDGSYSKSTAGTLDNKKKLYILKNTKYTTCKEKFKSNKEFCPSWSLYSEEMVHDKNKKIVKHKNTILKINKFPILYTPYLSHPDPTVKRQSGFLVPTIKTISNLGRTVKIPYFYNVAPDKDLTFTPIIYFDENSIFNTSYRQALKNGMLKIESSYSKGYKRLNKPGRTKGSRNYFFTEYNGLKNDILFKNNEISFKIQKISQQNYVKVNKLNTSLFKQDIRNLENTFHLQSYSENKRLDLKTGYFENLDEDDANKYTYFFPDGKFSYHTNKNKLYNFNLNTYFQGTKFQNNQKQGKIKNNLDFKGKSYIFKNYGLSSSLNLSVFNRNIYNNNVTGLKNDLNINNNLSIAMDNQLPFAKLEKNSYKTFTPRIFIKYTSGTMQNAKDQNKILDFSDIFSMNRTNSTDLVETGSSLGYGFDYFASKNKTNSIEKIYSAKLGLGQILKKSREEYLPTISSLNNKSSDFSGYLNFDFYGKKIDFNKGKKENIKFIDEFNQNKLSINYKFNIENDLSEINRNNLMLNTYFNSFYGGINFNSKNNHVGNEKFLILNVKKMLSDNYFFNLENKKNLNTNNSEYNRISINYENDCILTSLAYSKDFYNDKDITNSKTLIFGITIKPFSDNLGPDLTQFIN